MAITRTFSVNLLTDVVMPSTGGVGSDPATAVLAGGGWVTASSGTDNSADYLDFTFFDSTGTVVRNIGEAGWSNPAVADYWDALGDRRGAALVAEDGTGNIVLRIAIPNGIGLLAGSGAGSNPDVAVTGDGSRIAVVQQRNYGGTDNDIILTIRDANGSVVKTLTVDNTSANDQNPVIVDAAGRFTVAWNRIDGGATSLWYASYDDDGKLAQAPTLIDSAGYINKAPSIVEGGDGFVISYEDNQTFDSEIKTYNLGFDGVSSYTQSTSLPGVDGQTSVARLDGLYLTAFAHDFASGEELRAREIHLSIVDESGAVLTDPAKPIVIAASGAIDSNPSIDDFGFFSRGRFIVSYDSTMDGQVHQQLAQLVETITGDEDANSLSGRATGIVKLYGRGGSDKLFGNFDNDVLDGGANADQMRGLGGDDTYFVDNAGDAITEKVDEGAADWVKASVSYDLLTGVYVEKLSTTNAKGTAKINLYGNEIAQEITGNAAANVLSDGGKGGSDTLVGLGGNDTYKVYNSGTKIVEGAGAGSDTVQAAVDYTVGKGVYIQVLETTNAAGTTALSLYSNEFGQTVNGNAGANMLRGYAGDDTINGGAGADRISGGLGNDILAGNAGADIYYFSYALNGTTNVDTIKGFSSIDLINLSSSIFTKAGSAGALAAGAFWASADGKAHDASDRIIWETDTGRLYYDSDGTGAAARVLFAVVTGNTGPMNAGDFVIA
ncbi:MAG: calcium-binding protein [Rhizobiaceae bacterium]|nr:calcium-binding protein [Rhizobiaceae bacterium]